MKFARIAYCIKKAYQLGALRTAGVIKNRCHLKIFDVYWRKMAHYNKARWSWTALARKHTYNKTFANFFNHKQNTPSDIAHQIFVLSDQTAQELCIQAVEYQHHIFNTLGSKKQSYASIPWHCDTRVHDHQQTMAHSAICYFDPAVYYKDIHITVGHLQEYSKDIKVPWELSRLQHLLVIAQAYKLSSQSNLLDAFVTQWDDWVSRNPFLKGAAWSCPMDVGIRAVNLVLCCELLKNEPRISPEFWQRYTASLYDHLFYLEHNWEYYDSRTSNHYLSDLIGYLYLCSYFIALPGMEHKLHWCHQELLREFEKQVFEEGTDYEGSTCYHRLVTEIFYHWYLVALEHNKVLPLAVYTKLQRMFDFLAWCMPNKSTLIQIGDNDSGKITYAGISWSLIQSFKPNSEFAGFKKNYADFGLLLYKDTSWHGSLRSYRYHSMQPSGHFHNDANSITLSYQGQPLIIDPGSFIYTPSVYWRNLFRSVAVHSTFYSVGQEPIAFDERLFALNLPTVHSESKGDYSSEHQLYSYHDLYSTLRAHRLVEYGTKHITIQDWWTDARASEGSPSIIPTAWSFCLHESIVPTCHDTGIILKAPEHTFYIHSEQVSYQFESGWMSAEYGRKTSTYFIRASQDIEREQKVITTITIF